MTAEGIKVFRKELKKPNGKSFTQTDLAEATGVTKTAVANWEQGLFNPSKLAQRALLDIGFVNRH
ncbi:hypothetical protein ES703_113149 [subsurface metagenome]